MWRSFAILLPLVTLSGVTACPSHDTRLDDAIRQYVEQRETEVEAACQCYQLFLNPNSFDHGMFTSEEECLETLWPAPEDDVVKCMKSVLDSSGYGTEDSVDVVKCYTEAIGKTTDCYTQNAGECSQSACSSDVDQIDECKGQLTSAEGEALYYCAVQ
jgi:hypothetical protein